MIEPTPMPERENRRIREVARALLTAMQEQGHICLHGEDWGRVKEGIKTLESGMSKMCDRVDELTEEVAQSRGEKKMAIAIVGFLGAVLGLVVGTLGVIFGR